MESSDQPTSSTIQADEPRGEPESVQNALQAALKRFAERPAMSEERERQRDEEDRRRELDKRRWAWQTFIAIRGKRYATCRFDTFDTPADCQREALTAVMGYAEQISERIKSGQNVILFGPPGTGKDHLMVAMAREAFRQGSTVAWANGQDLFALLRDGMKEGRTERESLSHCFAGDVLYLSDPLPPTGDNRQFQQETLFRIVDRCYASLTPVWVTLNVKTRKEAAERLGPQTVDRLMHGALIVPCDWPSFREPVKP